MPPPPGVAITPEEIPGTFLVRQKLSGVFGGHYQSFEAALQKTEDTLTVIGLTPFGTKAFVLVQKGREIQFKNYLPKGRSVPLKPEYLLADIHHAFFLPAALGEEAGGGWRRLTGHGGELVREEQRRPPSAGESGRRVDRRTFAHSAEEGARRVTIEYEGELVGGVFPAVAKLDNGYYEYALRIETVSYEELDPK